MTPVRTDKNAFFALKLKEGSIKKNHLRQESIQLETSAFRIQSEEILLGMSGYD